MKGAGLAATALMAAAVAIVPGSPGSAAAKGEPGAAMFARLTDRLDVPRRAQFCGYVARHALKQAGNSPDPAMRLSRAKEARQLAARLAPLLAKANAGTSADQLRTIERENGEMMGLLSYAPSDRVKEQLRSGESDDILGLFITDVSSRCHAMLDRMKVPPPSPPGPDDAGALPPFTWRGESARDIFAGTGLEHFEERLCTGGSAAAADFAGAHLSARGKDGISLLDWAMQCGDRQGFVALLNAGFDPAQPGITGRPVLVLSAKHKDSFYLQTLLERGISPDAAGDTRPAVAEAYDPVAEGGGANFQLLREAGANLNLPTYDWSMWSTWALYARWEEILANWSEFRSDPVALGRTVSMELERRPPRGNATALDQIKQRLIAEHGVCFPVGPTFGMPRDERGFYLQPECPKSTAANSPSPQP